MLFRSRAELAAHIAAFNNPDVPYLSALMPFLSTDEGDYDHLARLREWRNASEAET